MLQHEKIGLHWYGELEVEQHYMQTKLSFYEATKMIFWRATAMQSALYVIARPSVCPSHGWIGQNG